MACKVTSTQTKRLKWRFECTATHFWENHCSDGGWWFGRSPNRPWAPLYNKIFQSQIWGHELKFGKCSIVQQNIDPNDSSKSTTGGKNWIKTFIFLKIIRRSWLIVTRLLLVHLWRKTVFVDVFHVHTLGHRLPMMLCRKLVVLRQCESIHRNLLRVILTGVMIPQKIFTLFPTCGVSCVGSFSETLCFCTFLSVSSWFSLPCFAWTFVPLFLSFQWSSLDLRSFQEF